MPGRLPAPANILDAIFAHTNKLAIDDRQTILRFLAGNEPRTSDAERGGARAAASSLSSSSSTMAEPGAVVTGGVHRSAGSASHTASRGASSEAMMVDAPVSHAELAPPPPPLALSPAEQAVADMLVDPYYPTSLTSGRRRSRNANRQQQARGRHAQPIQQILLHEERRIELRPNPRATTQPPAASALNVFTPSSSANSSSASLNSNGNGGEAEGDVPTTRMSLGPLPSAASSASETRTAVTSDPAMKPYTIIDQIIFEMDYTTGCWRKLRRRIRMAGDRQPAADLDVNGVTTAAVRATSTFAATTVSTTAPSTATASTTASRATPSRLQTGVRGGSTTMRPIRRDPVTNILNYTDSMPFRSVSGSTEAAPSAPTTRIARPAPAVVNTTGQPPSDWFSAVQANASAAGEASQVLSQPQSRPTGTALPNRTQSEQPGTRYANWMTQQRQQRSDDMMRVNMPATARRTTTASRLRIDDDHNCDEDPMDVGLPMESILVAATPRGLGR